MIGEIRQNFTEASASVGLILATALHMNTKERILTPRVFSTVIKTKYCVECLQGQRVLKIVVPELLA